MANNLKTLSAKNIKIGFLVSTALVSIWLLGLVINAPGGALAGIAARTPVAEQQKTAGIEERWGIRIESLRTSAAGNLLDFRYRIIDPEKAAYLVDRRNRSYLIDQESGRILSVPTPGKVGPLRQTVRYGLPKKDRVYFILFGNPHLVETGDRVTIVIGDFTAENMLVD